MDETDSFLLNDTVMAAIYPPSSTYVTTYTYGNLVTYSYLPTLPAYIYQPTLHLQGGGGSYLPVRRGHITVLPN